MKKVKPLNSGHLRVLKNLSVIERYPLLGGNLTLSYLGLNILSAIQSMYAIGRFHCISKWFHVKKI